MYLTRRNLYYIIFALVLLVVLLAIPGCGGLNPSWGGSRW